jgi:hypothetical protein
MLIALTVGAALVGIVMFGSLTGSMHPFILQRIGFDPASASAPFVATLVDVAGLVINCFAPGATGAGSMYPLSIRATKWRCRRGLRRSLR